MDKLKSQIQQRLTANIIIDKCAQSEYLIFRDAWCTQDRVIRFTTPFFRKMFPCKDEESGRWGTGDSVMYEAHNGAESFVVNCVLCLNPSADKLSEKGAALLKVFDIKNGGAAGETVLHSWDMTRADGDANKLFEDFDNLIGKDIPRFEQKLREKAEEDKPGPEKYKEGESASVVLNKYERNPKARAACLAAHGTACSVCGIDFGKEYGPEFEGKIEVHHIVPLSEIGAEYTVDPVKDLVPVCPNCHSALHSKPGGVYTVDELKKLKERNTVKQ